nr:hypothetical protein [Tanacetum cinerariifolium]
MENSIPNKLETKLWNHVMVRVGHAAYTDRFHELASNEANNQSVVLKVGVLTDEAIRNGSIKKNPENRGNRGEPSKDRNVSDDNKRSRTMSAFTITLFDSGAYYSFASTTFILLLGIDPNDLGFSYKTEITSGQLVEIDKLIRGCKLEIEGHVFDINLIPFGSRNFDVIIGIWPVLRVLGEKPEENMRQLMSAKDKEKKQEEMVVVRNFLGVFSNDLSRFSHVREIEFWIELVLGAMPVAKSPYRLAPFELEEFLDPSKIEFVKNWKAPRTLFEKSKTYDWGEEQKNAFQTLKDKLCNAPVLALLDRPEDFVVYYERLA